MGVLHSRRTVRRRASRGVQVKVPAALNKKIGPLPLIAWIGLLGAGVAIAIWIRKRNEAVAESGFASPTEFAESPGYDVGAPSGSDWPPAETSGADLFNILDAMQAGFESTNDTLGTGFDNLIEGQDVLTGTQAELIGLLDSMNETNQQPIIIKNIIRRPKGRGGKGGTGKGKHTKPRHDAQDQLDGARRQMGKRPRHPSYTGGGIVQGNPAQRLDVANIIDRSHRLTSRTDARGSNPIHKVTPNHKRHPVEAGRRGQRYGG